MRKQIFLAAVVAAFSATIYSCADSGTAGDKKDSAGAKSESPNATMAPPTQPEEKGVMVGGSMMVPSKNIVENAAGSSDHSTLVSAVKAAGLAETLSGAGPFTVFAPTNAAFEKLPAGAVEGLLKPEKKADLTKVLTYHVVAGSFKAADLKDGQKLETVQGEKLTVSVKDGKVMIDGATVTIPDVISSNGVTHVIDAVVMPKK